MAKTVHELSDGRQVVHLVPGHEYEFNDGKLSFVCSLLEVNAGKFSILCVFRDAEGKAKTFRFT